MDTNVSLQNEIQKLYDKRVQEYGDSYKSVNYSGEALQQINFKSVMQVIKDPDKKHSLLDVGCGLTHLYEYILRKCLDLTYTGIDLSEDMITAAKKKTPSRAVHCGTLFDLPQNRIFDFVVAIGVFTRKAFKSKEEEMIKFVRDTIREMYRRAECGIAFNMVTSYVDYRKSDLYYTNPAIIFDFCCKTLTRHVVIRHDYPLWDFTVYAYKPEYIERIYNFYR